MRLINNKPIYLFKYFRKRSIFLIDKNFNTIYYDLLVTSYEHKFHCKTLCRKCKLTVIKCHLIPVIKADNAFFLLKHIIAIFTSDLSILACTRDVFNFIGRKRRIKHSNTVSLGRIMVIDYNAVGWCITSFCDQHH